MQAPATLYTSELNTRQLKMC